MSSKRKLKRHKRTQKDTRMRYITIPEPVTLQTLSGVDVSNNEKDRKPLVLDIYEFIQTRMIDPKFSGENKGYEECIFMSECKAELDRQQTDEDRKVLELENEFWKRLVVTIRDPTGVFDARWSHSMVPIMRAVIEATDKSPLELEKAAPLAASAFHPTPAEEEAAG